MANTTIQLKKSGTPGSSPSNLANGELAINYADGKLYYKAANGAILSISGSASADNFGTVNANGTLIVADTPGDYLTLIAGQNISIVGDVINDSITISASITSNGGASVTVSDTAPSSPGNGDLWWNSDQLKMFIYYVDSNSSQWIETSPSYLYSLSEEIAVAAFNKANNALANTAGITTAGDLNVSGNLTLDSVTFDENAAITVTANGQLAWNADEHTLDLMMDSSSNGVVQQIGQETYYHVKNETGSTISDGTVVMISSTDNTGKILVEPAISDGTYPSQWVMGVTTQDIANGSTGLVTAFGKVRKLNTSAFLEGDILYADPAVPGGLTATVPTAPNNKTIVAFVTKSDASNGVIFVRTTYSLMTNDIDDIELISLANNDVLVYEMANSRFENRSQTTLIPYLHANAAYSQANAAYALANTGAGAAAAFDQANTAYNQANAAYLAANNAVTDYSPAFIQANTARSQANSAYSQANLAYSQANLVFNQANAAYVKANSSVNTFVGLTDVPSSYAGYENYLVAVNSGGTGLEFTSNIALDELIHTARIAPTSVANDSVTVYVTATGTTPNREVAYKIKNEFGEEVIISSILT